MSVRVDSNCPTLINIGPKPSRASLNLKGIFSGFENGFNNEKNINIDDILELWEEYSNNQEEKGRYNIASILRISVPKFKNNTVIYSVPNNTTSLEVEREKQQLILFLSAKLKSKVNIITEFLGEIDLVLIMSVNPGFGGQKFMPEVLTKIKDLKKIQEERKLNFDIEIDGGINFDNSKDAIKAGANILVSGTTIFKSNNGDIKKNIELLKSK